MPCNLTAVQVLAANIAPAIIQNPAAHITIEQLTGCRVVPHADGLFLIKDDTSFLLSPSGALITMNWSPAAYELQEKLAQALPAIGAALAARIIAAATNGFIEVDESPSTYHIIV